MTDARSIVATVDVETGRLIERVARRRGLTEAEFAAQAIRRAAESDDDFDAFIQAGVDCIDRGEVVPHEEVMVELDSMIAKHRNRCG